MTTGHKVMQLQTRALTKEEKRLLTKWPSLGPFSEIGELLLGPAIFAGFFGALVILASNYLVDAVSGFDALTLLGFGRDRGTALLVLTVAVATCVFLYLGAHEVRWHRARMSKLKDLCAREDLRIETHRIEDGMLVREPEHGQAMFFLRDEEGAVLFVNEGDELLEDWEEQPLRLNEANRPRRELKIVREPETKDCVLLDFAGEVLSFSDCYVMDLAPRKWPADGKALDTPWAALEEQYELVKITS